MFAVKTRRGANPELNGDAQQHEGAEVFQSQGARRSMSSTSTSTVVRRYPAPQPGLIAPGQEYRASGSEGSLDRPHHRYPPSTPPIDTAFSRRTPLLNTHLVASPVVGYPGGDLKGNASINRLPGEILLMIFGFVFPRHHTFPQTPTPSPFPLRRVCGRWRAIIDEAPQFWLSLHPPLNSSKCTPPIANWYRDMIAKMSEKVTSFDHIVIHLPAEEPPAPWDLFQRLLPYIKKSNAVKVVGGSSSLAYATLLRTFSSVDVAVRRKQSDGPDLEHLKTVEWCMPCYPFQQCFPEALNLPWSSLRALPWPQLTSVTLCMRLTLHDCVFIFNNAQSMEHLVLERVSGHSSDVLYSQDVTHSLSRLRSLTMTAEVNLSTLFRKYPMPQLRELSLKLDGRDTGADLHQLTVPWRQLTHVAIDCFLSVGVAENIIRNLELVETLTLQGTLIGDGNWTVHNPLPSLKSFTLHSNNDVAGSAMVTHSTQHIFPSSIQAINAPLIPSTIKEIVSQSFGSLQKAELTRTISPHDFLFFLSLAGSLTQGKFAVRDTEDQLLSSLPSSTLTPLSFPALPLPTFMPVTTQLASLELKVNFQDTPTKLFLDALTLPNLTSFEFKATRSSSNHNSLMDLLKRSHCHLRKLSLNYPNLGNEQILEAMELFGSTLEDFNASGDLFHEDFGDHVFRRLTHGANNLKGCLCPRLQRLNFDPCTDSDFFFDMVASRSDSSCTCETCGKIVKLKHVTANFPRGCHNKEFWEPVLKDWGVDYKLDA